MDLHTLCLKISRSENLPVLPTVVVQILRLFDDPNVSPRSLEKLIEQDPALTAKILKVAGSSMYGMQSATSVSRALSVLGMNTLRSISISLAYQQVMAVRSNRPTFDKLTFWRHCLATGIGARGLMKMINPGHAEEAYIAGLMHDIGILALEKFVPGHLEQSLRISAAQKIPLSRAERTQTNFDHADIGAVLAEKWKLNNIVTNAIKYHDNPLEDLKTPQTTIAVAAANLLAYECGFPAMINVPPCLEQDDIIPKLDLSLDQVNQVRSLIMVEVDQADETLGSQRAA